MDLVALKGEIERALSSVDGTIDDQYELLFTLNEQLNLLRTTGAALPDDLLDLAQMLDRELAKLNRDDARNDILRSDLS